MGESFAWMVCLVFIFVDVLPIFSKSRLISSSSVARFTIFSLLDADSGLKIKKDRGMIMKTLDREYDVIFIGDLSENYMGKI